MKARMLVASMALSATGFIGIVSSEWYAPVATIPTQGDRPTNGFGSTFNIDGSPVKIGEKTTPVRALVTARAHIAKDEARFQASLPGVYLSQAEYDIYIDFVYQYGMSKWMSSAMRAALLAEDYGAACDALLAYRYAGGYDCSTPGNKRCSGVWTRQQARHKACMEAIQ